METRAEKIGLRAIVAAFIVGMLCAESYCIGVAVGQALEKAHYGAAMAERYLR